MGVKDFLLKPFEIETLVKAIKRSSQVQKASLNPKNATDAPHGFKATSPRLEKVIKIASKAAVTDASIMLLGESGVGKEVFANFVHDHSTRKEKPFVAINMAAIPENLLESELFGYEKGAFTDAVTSKVGHFEATNGGTIFLDEIAEMPYPLQAKLLRALQEKEIRRLGGQKSIKLDIRVISATNANLEQAISDGEFREDLFYRLNTIPINIPPLRQRVEEIIPLATHILSEQCERYGMEHKQFNAEAHDELESYNWPGNIRELISVIERAVILSESNDISAEDLFLEGRKKKKSIASMEKDLILEILDETEHDLDASAKMLGITLANFKKKLKKFEIEVEE
jgi:DNA-binding NtrC family response regulator